MKHLTLIVALFIGTMNLAQAQNEQKIASGNEDEAVIEGPRLTVDQTVCDLGEVKEGAQPKARFKITNTGTQPLVIHQVVKSCGCTGVTWPKQPLQPGDEAYITATYDSKGRPGNFTKTLTVKHNAEGGNVYLTLRGMVIRAHN